MALTDWVQTAAVIYFAWQQNRIFTRQNEIIAAQSERTVMQSSSSWKLRIKQYWPTFVMLALMLLTAYDIYDRHQSFQPPPRAHIYQYGAGSGKIFANFDPRPLLSKANTYRVMLACRIEDNTVDVIQDKRLEKSPAFEILNQPSMAIEIPVSDDFATRIKPGGLVDVYLIAIPKSVSPDSVVSLSSIQLIGGNLVDTGIFGLGAGHFNK